MSSALAVEGRFTVLAFLKRWTETGQLTYKFSVHENALEPTRVRATFSKPTPDAPAAPAVAHLYFRLDASLRDVLGFTVESETHFHSVQAIRFDEAILDHVVRRKTKLQQQQLVKLSDEFSSTRVPALVQERKDEARDRDREALEEYLLERFQRKDPYNDGRVAFHECRDVLFALELPNLARRDREILFAFVELDRDDMVDYGALVAIGAEVLDTLLHAIPEVRDAKTRDEKHDADGAKDTDMDNGTELDDAVECFRVLARHRQFATMDQLAQALEAFRPAPPTPAAVAATDDADTGHAIDDEPSTALNDSEGGEPTAAAAAAAEPAVSHSHSHAATPPPPAEILVTRRQLRTSLEAPSLLLSRAEINLLTALATTTPAGLVPCAQLGELLQHVQAMIFRFQTQCFTDRIARYLLTQFTNYESSKLQGSAEHLKLRIRQREIKTVVKDMKKLLLSPLQISRLVALCDGASDVGEPSGPSETVDPDRVVHYKEKLPRLVAWLAKQVDTHELRTLAVAAHALQREPIEPSEQLPEDDELVRQLAVDAFEARDEHRVGVLSASDFRATLAALARALGNTQVLADPNDVAAVAALADPTGQGRVNYIYFQQLVVPVLRWLHDEQRIARAARRMRDDNYGRADAKTGETNHNDDDDGDKSDAKRAAK